MQNKKKTATLPMRVALLLSALLFPICGQADAPFDEANAQPDYLVLVNPSHTLPTDFLQTIELIDVQTIDGRDTSVEKATLAAYEALKAHLSESGIVIGISSAFRTVEDQARIVREFTEIYGEEYARRTAAAPGTSEHHTGLALDIVIMVNGKWITENEDLEREEAIFKEIHKQLAAFGFILRYPKTKEDICGYRYEPWHIRYVGSPEIAGEIMDRGLALEEYLEERDA